MHQAIESCHRLDQVPSHGRQFVVNNCGSTNPRLRFQSRAVESMLAGTGAARYPPLMPLLAPADLRRATRQLTVADPVLAEIIRRVGPCTLKLQTRRFESLARAIIAQQISGAAAKSIFTRLNVALQPRKLTPAALAALPDENLRACGVSPQKLGYLRDLQDRVLSRDVRLPLLHRLADEEVIAALVRVKGIGVWTAQMFLMFSLGRLDVLPHLDLGIRAGMQRLYGLGELPDRATCEAIAAPWRPYATIACWYVWRTGDK